MANMSDNNVTGVPEDTELALINGTCMVCVCVCVSVCVCVCVCVFGLPRA